MIEQTMGVTTLAEFEAFVLRPENSEKRFELVMGEIIEVPSNPLASVIAFTIGFYIRLYLTKDKRGRVGGADGGYYVNGHLFAPDVAYISYQTDAVLEQEGFNKIAPDLAVEVISNPQNSDEQAVLRRKLIHYRAAGVVVWIVDPFAQTVEVYQDEHNPMVLSVAKEDVLSGGVVLPGFELALKDIFDEPMSEANTPDTIDKS